MLTLYLGFIIVNLSEQITSTVFPIEAAKFNMTYESIGLTFSIFPMGIFIASVFLGKTMTRLQIRKYSLIFSIILNMVALALLYLMPYF